MSSGPPQPPPPGGGGGGGLPPQYNPQQQQQQQYRQTNMNPTPLAPIPQTAAAGTAGGGQRAAGLPASQQQQQRMSGTSTTGIIQPEGGPSPMDISNSSQRSGGSSNAIAGGAAGTTNPTAATTAGASSTTNPATSTTAAAAAAPAPPAAPTKPPTVGEITDQSVLDYLKQKGMSTAVLELQQLLDSKKKSEEESSSQDKKSSTTKKSSTITQSTTDGGGDNKSFNEMKEEFDKADDQARSQRTILTKSTGGGFGYDRDAAAPIVQWGVPDVIPPTRIKQGEQSLIGQDEAKAYLDAFCRFQLWILTLPDDYNSYGSNIQTGQKTNIFAIAKEWIEKRNNNKNSAGDSEGKDNNNGGGGDNGNEKDNDLSSLVDAMISSSKDINQGSTTDGGKKTAGDGTRAVAAAAAAGYTDRTYHLPPSSKPELLSVSFALLVHTYCELLEVGMETTAHTLRDSFKPIYDPIYGNEYKDLYHCTTTADMVQLNTHNSQHMEALNNLKGILIQIGNYQIKTDELLHQIHLFEQQQKQNPSSSSSSSFNKVAAEKKVSEYHQNINALQQRHKELSSRASIAFDRMNDLPFLRRARAVRWQLTLSTSSYGLLSGFLSSSSAHTDSSLLAMSTLLQTKCELHIEQRDPLPFTPTTILLEDDIGKDWVKKGKSFKQIAAENISVNWAAPLPRQPNIEGDSTTTSKKLPFPRYHLLDKEYETPRDARRDKRAVEFNRAILVNGFRRLEALERKREYEVMEHPDGVGGGVGDNSKNAKDGGSTSISHVNKRIITDPMEPSILLATLCANNNINTASAATAAAAASATLKSSGAGGGSAKSSGGAGGSGGTSKSKSKKSSGTGTAAADRHKSSSGTSSGGTVLNNIETLWEESGIGLTCAKLCPPDGRRVAVGCDDAAVRIWDLKENRGDGEVGQVLVGHKNGFPVFDVSWNKDGRSLLSAGGDGSIRLWDTLAQGPFGTVCAKPTTGPPTTPAKKATEKMLSAQAREGLEKATKALEEAKEDSSMNVPGLKPESSTYQNGAALAVYRGHAPNTPIWSVAFAPCGYYFASSGGDATARLWTTDHPVPVRLFAGHTSNAVNAVTFHPNCNYILTGGEDKTARLWDIQTGTCVRLLTGSPTGINAVEIDPSGQYAAGADGTGTIHLWDLSTGKKVTELRSSPPGFRAIKKSADDSMAMIHTMSFSACGTALATGGDDRCVKVWDVRRTATEGKPFISTPVKTFQTRRTILLDLQYTKRNLLLSVGKYITAVPIVPALSD